MLLVNSYSNNLIVSVYLVLEEKPSSLNYFSSGKTVKSVFIKRKKVLLVAVKGLGVTLHSVPSARRVAEGLKEAQVES